MRSFAQATGEPRVLFDAVARRAGEALDACCGVGLLSDDGARLVPTAFHDRDPAVIELISRIAADAELRLEAHHLLAQALRSGQALHLPSLSPEMVSARVPRAEAQAAVLRLGVRSALFVPMHARGEAVGGFILVRYGAAALPFDDDDLDFAQNLADHAALAVKNAQLLARARAELVERDRLELRLRLLSGLGAEFTAAWNNHERLFDLVARRLGEVLGGICVLRFVSGDRTWMADLGAAYHPDPDVERAIRELALAWPQRADQGIAARVLHTGQAVRIPKMTPSALAALVEERFRPLIESLGITSLMAIPLRAQGDIVAVAGLLRSDADRPCTEDDLALFEDIAAHATLAIINARLFAEVQRELAERKRMADRLGLLSELSKELLGASGDARGLLALVARRVAEVVGEVCSIRMIAPGGEYLEADGVVHDPDSGRIAPAVRDIAAAPQRLGEGVAGRVAVSGETVLIPTLDEAFLSSLEPRYRAFCESLGIRSLIAVALREQTRVLGVAVVFRSRRDDPYTDADRRLLEDIAAHASLAIVNSRQLEAEQVLRRNFLEAAPDPVLILDAAGNIVLVNTQTEAMFGYPRAELIGRPIELLMPAQLHAGPGLDLFARRKDGSELSAELSFAPIDTAAGRLMAVTVRDATERRRELEDRNRKTQEANRLKSEFLANMSHELRTPLNAIIGFAALMHAGRAGPMADLHKEYLGDILSSARHLLQLINDILDLAKVEAGRVEVRPEPVDLPRLAGEVRDILRGLAADKGLQFTVEVAISGATVDPRMLKQILYNFLSNAIKFTPGGGRVALRITGTDGELRVDVEDTGIGIKPEDMSRLFVEFQQLDASTTKRHPGTGLGLALTRRLAELHGGRVEVKSTPGVGSTFSAIMPREVAAFRG